MKPKDFKMKITRRQLRKIIKESLLLEAEMLPIVVNEYEDVDDYNILANYALTNDIQGALADPALRPYVEKNEMGWVTDEAGGWFEKVGEWDEMPAPEGWNRDKAYQFLTDLENASYKEWDKMSQKRIKADPDKAWLKFLGKMWSSSIDPEDLPDIKWKKYKNYVRILPPKSISHGVGEIYPNKEDIMDFRAPGSLVDLADFLERRGGGDAGRRKPYKKSPPPKYD